jgi:hypothetical protein
MQTQIFSNPLTAIIAVGSGVLLGGGVWLILSAWRKSARSERSGWSKTRIASTGKSLSRIITPRTRRLYETVKDYLELFGLCFLLGIELLKRVKHRTQCRYLLARIRWIIFWRWFIHNLVMYYSNNGDDDSRLTNPS